MKWSFLLFSSFLCLQAIAQYPATGNKMRLGWQTTGDGLVYRGAIGDTATLDPSGLNNAWMLLDTANGNLYAYRIKAWRLVSGGADTTSLSNRIDMKLNLSDTSVFARDFQISGTTNYISKFTGTNTIGNSAIYESAGNVGIGTTSPAKKLSVNGETDIAAGSGGYFRVKDGIVDAHGIALNYNGIGVGVGLIANTLATGGLALGGANTAEHMRIDASGNVGIGTTTPARILHVNATSAVRIPVGNFDQRGISNNGDIRVRTDTASMEYYSGAWRTVAPMARVPQSGLANRFSKFDANGLLDTSAVLVQANGKIGINNSPAAGDSALTVKGGIRATGEVRATRLNVNTFSTQVLSINNFAPAGAPGNNLWIGNGGQLSTWASGNQGSYNVSLGSNSLVNNTSGNNNLGLGSLTLEKNTTGESNAGIGIEALNRNISGSNNLALGFASLYFNTDGSFNTAIGRGSLVFNKIGNFNTGIGYNSLYNTTGSSNIGLGPQAMYVNTGGSYNIAIGTNALYGNTTGNGNIALGNDAGYRISSGSDNQTASNSIFIGTDTRANTSGSGNEIVIGYQSIGNGSNTTTIGNSSTTATIFQYGETRLGMAVDSGAYRLQVNGDTKLIGNLARKKPVTIAAATYTVLSDDSWLICNHTAQITITLPTAANSVGRELMIKYVNGGGATVISNATNISPIVGGALTNIILPATAGSWVTLVCDGANWIIMQKG